MIPQYRTRENYQKYRLKNTAALKQGIRNPETETESWKRKRKQNTESNINGRKLKNFTLHNLVQSKESFLGSSLKYILVIVAATPFSYINDASDDSNEVCLHITYLFLKALVFVSNVFLLALLSHENLHSLPIVVSSVFSPESTPLVIQQSPLFYSANLFICVVFLSVYLFYCHC